MSWGGGMSVPVGEGCMKDQEEARESTYEGDDEVGHGIYGKMFPNRGCGDG